MNEHERVREDILWALTKGSTEWVVFNTMTKISWECEDLEVEITGLYNFIDGTHVFWSLRLKEHIVVCEGSPDTDQWFLYSAEDKELVDAYLVMLRLCSVVTREAAYRDRLLEVESRLTQIPRPASGTVV